MSLQNYARCANAAVSAFQNGQYREAADKYLEAFKAAPGLWTDNRFYIFHGYVSILMEKYFTPLDSDNQELERLTKDKSELKLIRCQAAFTRAIICWDQGQRDDTAEWYRDLLRISEKATSKERKRKVKHVSQGSLVLVLVGDIIDEIVQQARDNLHRLEASHTRIPGGGVVPSIGIEMRSNGTAMPENSLRRTEIQLGPRASEMTEELADRLLAVGGK